MKVHLIGIAGTGMGSLAGLLKAAGHDVRGSDEHVYPPMSTQLAEQGIPVFEGFRAENLDWRPDRVVVGNVCRKDHVEVLAAAERQLALYSFPSLLSDLFLQNKYSVVVAGTHGKTTTSSILAHVLHDAGRDPSFLIGGVPLNFRQSWRLGQGPEFVIEGDEYDTAFFDKGSKFLHYRPRTAILTSVEFDHADIFRDEAAVKAAFRKFVALIPEDGQLLVCAASPGALDVAARRALPGHDLRAARLGRRLDLRGRGALVGGRAVLDIARRGERVLSLETSLPGIYNKENLVGVVAAAASLGVDLPAIARASRRFQGVRRRQEVRGVAAGVTVIDDFAHHPTAIRETVLALKGRYGPGKLIAAFEPRSATSRRTIFQHDFADALSVADEVVLAPLYAPEKIPEGERLDVERLAADLRREDIPARLIASVDETAAHIAERAAAGDTVLIMSSGDYGNLHDKGAASARRSGDAGAPRAQAEDRQPARPRRDRAPGARSVLAELSP